jgi:hypothetical protein
MLIQLVQRINVFDDSRIEIILRYRDELEALRQYITGYKERD